MGLVQRSYFLFIFKIKVPGLYHFRSWGYIILDLEFIFYKKPTILNLNAPLEVIFS